MPPSLHHRITQLVLGLSALLLATSGLLWGHATRQAIHEEVEAASRVAEQWLRVLAKDAHSAAEISRLTEQLMAVGRLRANVLEIHDAQGRRLYRSPQPTYKAGREAPAWFSRLVSTDNPPRQIAAGPLSIQLYPDASRAVLDAWDELSFISGWAISLLLLLGLSLRLALARTLAPLQALESALTTTATGRFDLRLPRHGTRELDQLATSYNQMAETLAHTLHHNAQLAADQRVAASINDKLEEERRLLARELHDELGQGITAVRAIAGAIAQRQQDATHGSAQAILAMTSQMQAGVRLILQRLRHPAKAQPLHQVLADHCQRWQSLHPDLALDLQLDPCPEDLPPAYQQCLLRLAQESLTNVVRHAQASRASVQLSVTRQGLALAISDDGRGCTGQPAAWNFGLRGMAERVAEWQGRFTLETPAGGGTRVCALLPWPELEEANQPCPTLP